MVYSEFGSRNSNIIYSEVFRHLSDTSANRDWHTSRNDTNYLSADTGSEENPLLLRNEQHRGILKEGQKIDGVLITVHNIHPEIESLNICIALVGGLSKGDKVENWDWGARQDFSFDAEFIKLSTPVSTGNNKRYGVSLDLGITLDRDRGIVILARPNKVPTGNRLAYFTVSMYGG